MFKKKKIIIILILFIVGIGGFMYFKNKKPKVQYTTQEARRGLLAQTVSVTGKLISPSQVDVSFRTSGRLDEVNVEIGDKVRKGQRLAKFNQADLATQLQQAKASVEAERQTLANMKRGAYKVEAEDAQRAMIEKSQAAVSEVYVQMRDASVYAPMEGIIIRKNYEVGENTAANTAIFTIAKEGDLEIEIDVPESDIVKMAVGQTAEVTLDAFTSEDKFSAVVESIEPAATVIQDVVYYKVKLKFVTGDFRFKNGMSADVDIRTNQVDNAVLVPERAVKEEDGKKYIEIIQDEKLNLTEKVFVTTGMQGDDGLIEIKSGLAGGEKVVTLSKQL